MSFNLKMNLLPGLPAYKGGRMSDDVYDDGLGRHVVFNDGNSFDYPADGPWTYWLRLQLPYAEHCGYSLSESASDSEFGPVIVSNGQNTYTVSLRNGKFSMQQTQVSFDERDTPALLRAVTETDRTAFDAYLDELKVLGFTVVWKNQIEENVFFALDNGQNRLFASFYGRDGVARFIQDDLSASIEDFGGGEPIPGETMQLCQFGLYYNEKPLAANCGMLYILKLPDNSLFLIDGGMIEQATESICAEVLRVMRLMTKTAVNEKIRIAGWFCTHAHDDHTDMFCKLLRKYHGLLNVERIIFNFPANSEWEPLLLPAHILFERLHKYCPDAKYLKCHTGQNWNLAGVDFTVLQTHEDAVAVTGHEKPVRPGERYDFNDSSTVLKISYEGASFMVLGDINNAAEELLLRKYSGTTFKSTAMQVAHHMINNLPELYPGIAPEIAFVPQSVAQANPNHPYYPTLLKTVLAQNIYFASCATDIFEAQEGHFRLIDRYPVEGYLYDGSPL